LAELSDQKRLDRVVFEDLVADSIGIDHESSMGLEDLGHLAFATGDPARDTEYQRAFHIGSHSAQLFPTFTST
jgi:hypothetical protein